MMCLAYLYPSPSWCRSPSLFQKERTALRIQIETCSTRRCLIYALRNKLQLRLLVLFRCKPRTQSFLLEYLVHLLGQKSSTRCNAHENFSDLSDLPIATPPANIKWFSYKITLNFLNTLNWHFRNPSCNFDHFSPPWYVWDLSQFWNPQITINILNISYWIFFNFCPQKITISRRHRCMFE